MIPQYYIFLAVLFGTCGYALWRGRSDERFVAIVCLLATLATRFALSPLSVRYRGVEAGLLIIDMVVLASFIAIALRSDRFWPLWVAGLQLTNSMAHLMKAIDVGLLPVAYRIAAIFWSYPILLILAIGTWRGHRRLRRQSNGQPPEPFDWQAGRPERTA